MSHIIINTQYQSRNHDDIKQLLASADLQYIENESDMDAPTVMRRSELLILLESLEKNPDIKEFNGCNLDDLKEKLNTTLESVTYT